MITCYVLCLGSLVVSIIALVKSNSAKFVSELTWCSCKKMVEIVSDVASKQEEKH